jgi:hypothetical protein
MVGQSRSVRGNRPLRGFADVGIPASLDGLRREPCTAGPVSQSYTLLGPVIDEDNSVLKPVRSSNRTARESAKAEGYQRGRSQRGFGRSMNRSASVTP